MVLEAQENKKKKDCFGYRVGKCTVLTEMVCAKKDDCPFYKTHEQFEEDAERARIKVENMRGIAPC